MKPAYGEIIRGEVSIFRGGAGGSPYLSSGSFNGAMPTGANWAIAPGNAINRIRKGKRRVGEAAEDLIGVEVVKAERIKQSRSMTHKSRPLNRPASLIENRGLVDKYSVNVCQRN
jgi:hypothetical protein